MIFEGKIHKAGTGSLVLSGFTCNLSLLNGVAFITNPSVTLLPYIGSKITLNDGSKNLVGWIKMAGTGETLSNICADDMSADNTGDWSQTRCALAFDTDHYTYDPSGVSSHAELTNKTVTAGKLYKISLEVKNGTGSTTTLKLYANDSVKPDYYSPVKSTTAEFVAHTFYFTIINSATNAFFGLFDATNFTGNIDLRNFSADVITIPSATGVTIVNAKGGSTFNWTSDGGIDPNATSFTATITVS